MILSHFKHYPLLQVFVVSRIMLHHQNDHVLIPTTCESYLMCQKELCSGKLRTLTWETTMDYSGWAQCNQEGPSSGRDRSVNVSVM